MLPSHWGRIARVLPSIVGGLNAVWLIVLFAVLLGRDRLDLGRGLPVPLILALGISIVMSALALVLSVNAACQWHRRDLSLVDRAGNALIALVALTLIPF